VAATPAPTIVGETARDPIAVQVMDTAGLPLADVLVSWGAAGGRLVPESQRTDSTGTARARWTLGPRSGWQRGYAEVGTGRAAVRIPVEVIAEAGRPAMLSVLRRGPLRGTVGEPVDSGIRVRVVDRAGNPVPGVVIAARTASGAGSPRPATTDSSGQAAVEWTLGVVAGSQHLTLAAEGVPHPAELVATAQAARPAKLSLEPLPASAAAGRPLPRAVEAVIVDAHGNGVPGALVTFTATAGKVTPGRVRTGASGRATSHWVLGSRAGPQRLEAQVAGLATGTAVSVKAVR
jgi:hypothetical protein